MREESVPYVPTAPCPLEVASHRVSPPIRPLPLPQAAHDGKAFVNTDAEGGSPAGKYINWLTISDQAASVTDDVNTIASHSLVEPGINVHGYVYDVKSGKLNHILSAVSKRA